MKSCWSASSSRQMLSGSAHDVSRLGDMKYNCVYTNVIVNVYRAEIADHKNNITTQKKSVKSHTHAHARTHTHTPTQEKCN